MVTNATALHSSATVDPSTAWQFVVRTAVTVSLVAVAVVYALRTFVGLPDVVAIVLVAAVGLAVSTRLPAATPPIPAWLLDEAERAELAA